jgi:CBS-domain-containing membrane protein
VKGLCFECWVWILCDLQHVEILPVGADNRIRHIPVVEGKGMKGMVSIGDVVRAVVGEHREELQRLNSFILCV